MHRMWLLVGGVLVACGPKTDAGSGADGSSTRGSAVTSTTTGGATTTSVDGTTVVVTSGVSTEASFESSTSDGGPTPTAGGCGTPASPPEVPVPRGCTSIPLLDASRTVLPDSPSGLVRCLDKTPTWPEGVATLYRTAAVPCPFGNGECLCDADCPTGHQCICDNASFLNWPAQEGNTCIPADCGADSDCDGQRCRAESGFCGLYDKPDRFHCSSPEDDCNTNADCVEQDRQYCAYDTMVELFTCSPGAVCE